MSFCWVTVNVRDLDASIDFYCNTLGLEIDRRFIPVPGTEIAFLRSEGSPTEVELIHNEKNLSVAHGRDISMGFTVDSVDTALKRIRERGIGIAEGPFQPNPSIRFFFILDPDGVRIQLVEHVGQPG